MNKAVFIGLGGLALAVVVGVIIFVKPFQSSPQSQGQISTETSSQSGKSSDLDSIKGTIKDLFARNVPLECTFNQAGEGVTNGGTIYLDGDKIRGNFQTAPEGQELFESFMIQDGEYIYTWSSEQSTGTKIKLNDMDATPQEEVASEIEDEQEAAGFENLEEQNIDYNCKPWMVDSSFFTPPGNIEFLDLGEEMEQMKEATDQVEKVSCDVCDQLPAGEAQDQCRQGLGCE